MTDPDLAEIVRRGVDELMRLVLAAGGPEAVERVKQEARAAGGMPAIPASVPAGRQATRPR